MNKKWFSPLMICLLLALAVGKAAVAAPQVQEKDPPFGGNTDDLSHPLGDYQRALKKAAVEGSLRGPSLLRGQSLLRSRENRKGYVELERLGEDTIWTILAEFGDQVHPSYGGTLGPLHNQIPKPNRKVDNTTIWMADFDKPYFERLLFSGDPRAISMRNYYIEQSSNRYAVNGDVTDWVQVPYNEARYGNNYCGYNHCATTWLLVRDGANAWYDAQIAAGLTPAEIDAYLSKFDVWDRYDYNGDGNFNEPDGYIDHFQIVHAGEGEETGGGAQGTDAIWSHRWYAFFDLVGSAGPGFNPSGGIKVGDSSFWIGDYTVEPENGGVGVFAHEFGHDLGLPDLYDTSGNTGGAENSTGFWTLYSSGSYGNSGRPIDGIGTKPVHMSAYEKIFLGWSNYQVVDFGQTASVKLGLAEYNTVNPQHLIVSLPDKQVSTFIGPPYAGNYYYHSGAGNDLDNSMTHTVSLPAGLVTLSAKVRYAIELNWDYAYLTVNGLPVATNLSTGTNPNGQNFGEGITGSSGNSWVDLTANLSAYAGQIVDLGFRYWTDVAVAEAGFNVDDIHITGTPLDGAEADAGWSYAGFTQTDGTKISSHFNTYVAEFRQYVGYDDALRTGPYNFGFLEDPDRLNWVEHFPYQDGLLVWYWDTSFANNNVGDNCTSGRCGGLYLPVDAHPELLLRPNDGKVWRARIQSYDSTFGLKKTDRICLHANSFRGCYGPLKPNPVFDDTKAYWVAPDPSISNFGWASVPLPGFGITIRVKEVETEHGFMKVRVALK